jgi:xanthine/uracil permease
MLRSPGLKWLGLPWAWPGRAARSARRWFTAPVVIKSLFGLLALVPVWPFVLAMHEEYEPTVFVMALVAIFVAAEHYGGLTENVETLEEKTTALQNRLGAVLNADGLNEWHAYGPAFRR